MRQTARSKNLAGNMRAAACGVLPWLYRDADRQEGSQHARGRFGPNIDTYTIQQAVAGWRDGADLLRAGSPDVQIQGGERSTSSSTGCSATCHLMSAKPSNVATAPRRRCWRAPARQAFCLDLAGSLRELHPAEWAQRRRSSCPLATSRSHTKRRSTVSTVPRRRSSCRGRMTTRHGSRDGIGARKRSTRTSGSSKDRDDPLSVLIVCDMPTHGVRCTGGAGDVPRLSIARAHVTPGDRTRGTERPTGRRLGWWLTIGASRIA